MGAMPLTPNEFDLVMDRIDRMENNLREDQRRDRQEWISEKKDIYHQLVSNKLKIAAFPAEIEKGVSGIRGYIDQKIAFLKGSAFGLGLAGGALGFLIAFIFNHTFKGG